MIGLTGILRTEQEIWESTYKRLQDGCGWDTEEEQEIWESTDNNLQDGFQDLNAFMVSSNWLLLLLLSIVLVSSVSNSSGIVI